MDLSSLNTAAADEGGVEFVPLHPATREPLDMTIKLRSANCESVRRKARALLKRLQSNPEFRKDGPIDPEFAEAQAIDRLITCTVSWSGVVYNGAALDCAAENARRIYGDPGLRWLRDQVSAFVEDQTNFLPKAVPSSTGTPSACSNSLAPKTEPPSTIT